MIRSAIDNALVGQTESIGRYVVIVLILGGVRALLVFVYRYGLYSNAFRIDSDLRTTLYRHLTSLSFSFYDKTQSGQIISRANSDIRSVQLFLTFGPLMGITMSMFIVAFSFMLTINVGLAFVAVSPLPGVFFLGARLRNEIFPLSWITQGRVADVATIVDENINGVRVIRSFAAEEDQIRAIARAATSLRWSALRTVRAQANYNPVIENLPRVGQLLVLLYGGWLTIEGQLTPGTLFAFLTYVAMLQAPFRMLGFFLMMSQRAKASAERIYEVLDEMPTVVDRPGAADLVASAGEVVFDDVTFGYGTAEPILNGFSMRVEAGETVAIVGRTGSGKSTIGRLLPRFYDVDGGAIRIDGNDVRDVSLRSLRHTVGAVADDPFLFSVSLADNIAYGRPGAPIEDIERAAQAAQADGFITDLAGGYDEVVGERGYTLSGGQRQRIAIARALLADPAVLILDDATSAIDVHVEERIHHALADRLASRTVIIIAHRLSTIALADRVVLLEGGKAAATGTHDELMASEPRYRDVLDSTIDHGMALENEVEPS
ncbi:MAG: ABC transporter ATP-binding protein [Acidimicrobiales bacterium]